MNVSWRQNLRPLISRPLPHFHSPPSPLGKTADIAAQGKLLSDAASLIDAGILRTTATSDLGIINAENLKTAHAAIETGRAHGKLVLAGF
jgi:hypothetical protein